MRLVTASCWHRQPGRCSLSGSRPFACSCASMKDRGRFMKDWMCASHVGRFAHSGPMTSTARNAAHRARAPLASTASSRTSLPAPSAVARCGAVCHVRRTGDASTAGERSEVVRAGRASNDRRIPGCREGRMTPRGAMESGFQIAQVHRAPPHAADACSRMPSACATRMMVSRRGCEEGCSALYRLSRPRPERFATCAMP